MLWLKSKGLTSDLCGLVFSEKRMSRYENNVTQMYKSVGYVSSLKQRFGIYSGRKYAQNASKATNSSISSRNDTGLHLSTTLNHSVQVGQDYYEDSNMYQENHPANCMMGTSEKAAIAHLKKKSIYNAMDIEGFFKPD